MAFTEDTSVFFVDFGEACAVNGVACVGIFDKAYAEQFGIVSGNVPILRIKDGALGSAVEGSTVVICSTTYSITGIEPDGTGMTVLRLEL